MMQQPLSQDTNNTISAVGLHSGIYLVAIVSENGLTSRKIVIE
jgi:hypothetical protein